MSAAIFLCAVIALVIYAVVAEARQQQADDNNQRLAAHLERERTARINAELDLAEARIRLAHHARRNL